MLVLLVLRAPFGQSACGRFIDSGDSVGAGRCGGIRCDGRLAKGEKTAGFAGGFSGISGALYAPSTLSIRQRSEMPKK
jgi:hypothetical protein